MAYTTPTFHQLHLLLVHTDNTAIRVGGVAVANHKAVRERGNLQVVANTGHRATLRDDIPKLVEQLKHILLAEGVGIVVLDTCNLAGDAVVHLFGRALVDSVERIFQRILIDPHHCGQVIPLKILLGVGQDIFVLQLCEARSNISLF